MLSKLSKNIKTISKLSKITKLSKNFNNFKYCQNVGQVMFPHHSDQMSQRSPHVSWVTLWMSISKVLSDWLSQWQGHLLSCCGQLKSNKLLSCYPCFVRGRRWRGRSQLGRGFDCLFPHSWWTRSQPAKNCHISTMSQCTIWYQIQYKTEKWSSRFGI